MDCCRIPFRRPVTAAIEATIVIGGCSSAGKSSLAFALQHIFSRAFQDLPITQVLDGNVVSGVSVLHQDHHLVPSAQQSAPLATFRPDADELHLVEDMTDPDGRVRRPNRDCFEATDWTALRDHWRKRPLGHPGSPGSPAPAQEEPVAVGVAVGYQDVVEMVREALLSELRAAAPAGMGVGLVCGLRIAEGFLMLARPLRSDADDGAGDEGDEGDEENEEAERDGTGCATVQSVGTVIRLFLPLTELTATERRFRRAEYTTGRVAGQWWKTKGYFRDVAWPWYVNYHNYILQQVNGEDQIVEGVLVRPAGLMHDQGGTVRWAAQKILVELRRVLREDMVGSALLA